jgi:6-phosphogluconolactonase
MKQWLSSWGRVSDRKQQLREACAHSALIGFLVLAAAGLPWVGTVSASDRSATKSSFVYVGTYTRTTSKGIYGYRFDAKTGQLAPVGLLAELPNSSFMVSDPHHRYLYAVSETGVHGHPQGSISSFAIDPKTGSLTLLNKVDSGGSGTCHVALDNTGKTLLIVNYSGGTVASFAIKADGSIGERVSLDQHTGSSVNPERQKGPHPHEVAFSPDNRFMFVPDLGTDQVNVYQFDAAKGTFSPATPPFVSVKAGLGPRHLIFGRGGKFAYLVCEMGSSVVVFSYDPTRGLLTPVQTISTLPAEITGENASAEIEVDRSGRFLYVSNRGHNSITVFAIDLHHGTLTQVQNIPTRGNWPRSFAIDPTGKYLLVANQYSNQMAVFAINSKDGQLTPTGNLLDIATPVFVLFMSANPHPTQ